MPAAKPKRVWISSAVLVRKPAAADKINVITKARSTQRRGGNCKTWKVKEDKHKRS